MLRGNNPKMIDIVPVLFIKILKELYYKQKRVFCNVYLPILRERREHASTGVR